MGGLLGIGGPGLGWQELVLILLIVMMLFGAKRLPEIARSMGKSMKEFKDATKGLADDVKSGLDDTKAPEQRSDDAAERAAADRGAAERKDE